VISREKSGHSYTSSDVQGVLDGDELLDKIDLLFEKRQSIRESALRTINNSLSARVCSRTIESRQESLANALQHIIQRKNGNESLLALRCVSLLAITLSEGQAFCKKFEGFLSKVIKSRSPTPPEVSAAIIDTFAVVCFMNSVDTEHMEVVSNVLSDIFGQDKSDMEYCAALNAWALILTTIGDEVIQQNMFPENIEKIHEFLDHSDMEVRIAAGKVLAIMVEALRNEYQRVSNP